MNEDDIVLQPDVPKVENNTDSADASSEDDGGEENTSSPRVFDFSSDLNISPVTDDPIPPKTSPKENIVASISIPKATPINFVATPPVSTPIKSPTIPVVPTSPTKPPASYREPIDQQKWPFAFGKPVTEQPLMNPSASAASAVVPSPAPAPAIPVSSAEKRAPMSQPVKTIRSEGGEQAVDKEAAHPIGGLQRDVLAILPNTKKDESIAAKNLASPASSNPNIKPLRTYESDVAEVLSHRKTSTASIAIAENKRQTGEERLGTKEEEPQKEERREEFRAPEPVPIAAPQPEPIRDPREGFKGAVVPSAPPVPTHTGRNFTYIALSLFIILAGLAGGYYFYTKSPLSAVQNTTKPSASTQTGSVASTKSLIPAESKVSIPVDGQGTQAIITRVQAEIAKSQTPNTIKEIVLTQNVSGTQTQIAPADIARALNIIVPEILLRTLQPKWMLGVYVDGSGTRNIFVAATTDTFQNAFSGMLNWESVMPHDLNSFINTGTSTQLQGRFIDEIVKNKDVRAFVTPASEQSVFIYSFLNNSLLVVSNSEVALSEIITRLENQAFVR